MTRRRSYSIIYKVQRLILMVFYTTTMIALSIPLVMLVTKLFPDHFFPLIATLVLYMVLSVVIGIIISAISYIPFNLANAFDPIKNDIASGTISDIDQLGKRITAFTVEFFDFAFLDITHAFIQTGSSALISHEDIPSVQLALGEYGMLEKSKKLDEIIRAGTIAVDQGDLHLYILPIWFGDQWIGYMGLLTEKRIGRFFQKFLMEYENNFLDDQIMHVKQLSTRENQ